MTHSDQKWFEPCRRYPAAAGLRSDGLRTPIKNEDLSRGQIQKTVKLKLLVLLALKKCFRKIEFFI